MPRSQKNWDSSLVPAGADYVGQCLLQERATARRSPVRNFLMHSFHMLVMAVVGNNVRDTQCGFKVGRACALLARCYDCVSWVQTFILQLFTRTAAHRLFMNQRLQRWCFDVELVYLAQKMEVVTCLCTMCGSRAPNTHITVKGSFFPCLTCPDSNGRGPS